MGQVTAALVKHLREKTGAGMMDCKKALSENGGDMDAAVDWLRTKGLAAAAKKAGRIASEGLIGVALSEDGRTGALIEVNAETDFVARNDTFQAFVDQCARLALEAGGDIDRLAAMAYPGGAGTVQDQLFRRIRPVRKRFAESPQELSLNGTTRASCVSEKSEPNTDDGPDTRCVGPVRETDQLQPLVLPQPSHT
jgi:elongation factor Ts